MSMKAEVVAVGAFTRKVAGYMEYPVEFYRDTREGVPVLRVLFRVYNGANVSMRWLPVSGYKHGTSTPII